MSVCLRNLEDLLDFICKIAETKIVQSAIIAKYWKGRKRISFHNLVQTPGSG